MPRFLPLALSALLATHAVAGSSSPAWNAMRPKSGAAAVASLQQRELAPLTLNQFGTSLFGAPSSNSTFDRVEFGMAVALSSTTGTRLAVGAPFHDWTTEGVGTPNEDGGAVFLYDHDGTDWNYLWHTVGVPDEKMGERVSLSADGSRIAVRRKDTSPHYVEVFDISPGGNETQVGLDVPGQADGDTVTLSRDGLRLVVSSESWDSSKGRVEIFELQSGSWVSTRIISGFASNDYFGWVTAFSSNGERLAISSPNYDGNGLTNRGRVRVYDYDGGAWSTVGNNIFGSDSEDQLGFSMDMSGDGQRIIVGSPGANATGTELGKVGVYEYDGTNWVLVGNEIEGVEANDRFGRSVSISDDGSRIAASSYFHDGQRGQVRFFELIGGVWTQLGGDIDGLADLDRFGYGIMSVSMTGDGTRLASGSVWADDVSGSSTGSVRVFDGIPDDTSSPSMAPSQSPAPSAIPTVNTDTDSPTTTASPTEYVNLDKFSWDIIRLGDAIVAFDDASATEEIQFNYNISRRDTLVVVYEQDCNTTVPSSVVGVAKDMTATSSSHGTLEVDLDIKQDTVVGSGIWADGDVGVGYISLCLRLDLLLDDPAQTSVHFHETKIVLTIDLTQGFTVSEVLDLDRTAATQEDQNAELEYTVLACQCDSSLVCLTQTLTQGDDVYLCLETNATNVEFVGIESLDLTQEALGGTLTRSPIANGLEDPLTAVSLQGDKCNIRTQMASSFFIDDEPATVLAQGIAVMAFTNSNRRLRAKIAYRDLQESDSELTDVGYKVDVPLKSGPASSAVIKGTASAVVVVLSGIFILV